MTVINIAITNRGIICIICHSISFTSDETVINCHDTAFRCSNINIIVKILILSITNTSCIACRSYRCISTVHIYGLNAWVEVAVVCILHQV